MTPKNVSDQPSDSVPTRRRAFCYITSQSYIVLLAHVDYPHLALQIPGGTIEPGEAPEAAALREAEEETGLSSLKPQGLLGRATFDMRPYGNKEIIDGFFFHFSVDEFEFGQTWRHDELHAHGGGGPIRYELSWFAIDNLPAVHGNDARFIDRLPCASNTWI